MSRSKGKARKGKRTAPPQAKDVQTTGVQMAATAVGTVAGTVEGLAVARTQGRPDEEPTRIVINPLTAASAERFVAHPELTPPPLFEDKDDMGDYLGEIFYARPQVGNDIALDMETLQPVSSAGLVPITMRTVMAGSQVRDLIAEFEDAPTLPETVPIQPHGFGGESPLHLAPYEEEPLRSVRVNGR